MKKRFFPSAIVLMKPNFLGYSIEVFQRGQCVASFFRFSFEGAKEKFLELSKIFKHGK